MAATIIRYTEAHGKCPSLNTAARPADNGFDKFVRGYNTPVDVTCPTCESEEVERKISAVGVTGVWQSNAPQFEMPKPQRVHPDDPFRCIA